MSGATTVTRAAQAVQRLGREHPNWMPALEAAVAVAEQAEPYGGEFAGARVLRELAHRGGPSWFPNLRIFVSYGLLEKSGPSTRGGRRGYYRMPDRTGVANAIAEWRANQARAERRPLSFISSGASSEPPYDTGRRAGEIAYEPRSWR